MKRYIPIRTHKQLNRVAFRVWDMQQPTPAMVQRLHACDAKFSEPLKGVDELAKSLNFEWDLVNRRGAGFRTTWSQHDLMMLQQRAGEEQNFLITIPQAIRDAKPEMGKRRLQRQG